LDSYIRDATHWSFDLSWSSWLKHRLRGLHRKSRSFAESHQYDSCNVQKRMSEVGILLASAVHFVHLFQKNWRYIEIARDETEESKRQKKRREAKWKDQEIGIRKKQGNGGYRRCPSKENSGIDIENMGCSSCRDVPYNFTNIQHNVYERERERGREGTCVPDDTCVYYMPKISFGRCPNGRWIYTNGEISGKPEYLAEYVRSRVQTSIRDVCGLIHRDRCRRITDDLSEATNNFINAEATVRRFPNELRDACWHSSKREQRKRDYYSWNIQFQFPNDFYLRLSVTRAFRQAGKTGLTLKIIREVSLGFHYQQEGNGNLSLLASCCKRPKAPCADETMNETCGCRSRYLSTLFSRAGGTPDGS